MSIGVNLRVTGHTSIGGRKYQEDYFSVAYQQTENDQNLEYAYFGIYDGHGGAEASLYAKEHLMNTIVSQKQFWSENDEDVLKSIREGYIQTHYSMWREQDKWPKTSSGLPSTAGTTASIAFIRRGKIYIGHVGDSGIVLGYQKDKESAHTPDDDGRWVASPLTEDHKPESYAEKMRIVSCGGKVVTKSGVPRVVWNRPRIGHKGPVRRSTPIDEIPFLAVARSLGDLWSYNSAVDEFIVSPVPDVSVIEIDPKKFRCLIFGTDGLWNVISPKSAVEIVRNTEMENIRIALEGGNEWKNPSKLLVNEALERWSRSNMKADNTSVVIIMLDPPGPPKRDVLKSVKNSIQHAAPDCRGVSADGTTTSDMYDLFDCITRGEGVSGLPRSEPSETHSMRYLHHHHHQQQQQHHHQQQQQQYQQHHRPYHEEQHQQQQHQAMHHHPPHLHLQQQHLHHHGDSTEYYSDDQLQQQHLDQHHHHHQHHHNQHVPEQYCHPGPSTSYHHDLAYTDTDSFAESYNSLLDRSYDNSDHSYTSMFHATDDVPADCQEASPTAYQTHRVTLAEDDEEALIDYLPESDDETAPCAAESAMALGQHDSTYSLTNLQTKSERLRAAMVESEGSRSAPYYHRHAPQEEHAEEDSCYGGGNLAIIEHFHNYHHPPPAVLPPQPGQCHSVDEHSSNMYQMDMGQHYHQLHQAGSSYGHFHHAPASSQMERYDYAGQHHPTNNNLLNCEHTIGCSSVGGGVLSRKESVHDFGYGTSTAYIEHDATARQSHEEMDLDETAGEVEDANEDERVRLSGERLQHIQINEISSSYSGGGSTTTTTTTAAAVTKSTMKTEGASLASGDEENNASSTTQQLVALSVLPCKPRALKKPATSATRVITIFYETRSSRRKPRGASSRAGLLGVAAIGRIATKRRKTTAASTVVQSTISSSSSVAVPNPTLTLERRVLRSNGMNTATPRTTGPAGSRPLLRPAVNNFSSVSSTTLEAKPPSSGRTKADEPLNTASLRKRGTTVVATLLRTTDGASVLQMKHNKPVPIASVTTASRKATTHHHQTRTMLLRRTTQ